VSLATPAPPAEKTDGLTFRTAEVDAAAVAGERGRGVDVMLSLGLVLLVFCLWWYFS
jgi:hypothetical protein